jgi:DNA-binding HxlR family transcriptional regulator
MRKTNSTNTLNQQMLTRTCGTAHTLNIIGGRWKAAILCRLLYAPMRYGELKRSIEGISERMLVAQLKELEQDGIVERQVYPEVPPRVEYSLTPLGTSMRALFDVLSDWGNMHREKLGETPL